MKPLSQLLSDWRRARERIEKLNSNLPRIIGAESVKVVKENFRIQGYDSGSGVTKWAPRSDATNKSYSYGRKPGGKSSYKGSVYNAGNPLLMQSRNLFNSIKYFIFGKKVTIGSDQSLIPYNERMNEGGTGSFAGKGVTHTPPRKYMPTPNEIPNVKILKAIQKKLISERDKILRDFKKK